MKKFTTTFFLQMAMVLLLPTEVGAWSDVYLFSTIDGVWSSDNKKDNDKFTKTDDNTFYKDIDATDITGDISFCLYVTDNNGFEIFPYKNDDVITAEYEAHDSWSYGAYNERRDNRAWKIKHSSDGRDKYRIMFRYEDNTRKFYVNVIYPESTVYDPVLEKEDEISCFVEVPSTINNVKIWAWSDSYNYSLDVASSEGWSNRPSMTYMGETISGNKVYKWTYAGKQTGKPSKVIFTKGDDKFADGIAFINHGYYVYDGKNNIESSSNIDIITDVSGGSGGEGEDDDLTGFVPGATSNGNAYYLASKGGNLFNQTLVKPSVNTIKYNRILRFNDSGKGTYTVDIPATVTGDLYIEEVDKDNNVVAYYPTSSNKTISASVPANNAEVVGKLVNDLNYWAMTDRSGENDGLYTITLTLDKDGKPGKWSFKHDAARRVAYFFSTAENSSAYPVYSDITSHKFIGYNYFDPNGGARYYVISNITMNTTETTDKAKQLDPTLVTLPDGSATVNKLMIMGNGGQKFRDDGTSDFKPANEHKANEMSPDSEPMIAGSNLQGLCKVEYNPSNGDNNGAVFGNRYGMRGQIQVRQGGSAESFMTIVGPLVENSVSGGTWDWTYAVDDENVMKYNDVENCYEITITTKKDQEGKEFRFVQDKTDTKSWGETGEIARIPYYDTTKEGHAATVADPNDVIIKEPGTDNILFNRPAGKWTIKFYLENHSDGTTTYYYTINGEDNFTVIIPEVPAKDGKRYVLRTFSYGADMTPTDAGVHIYVAHDFSATPENGKKLSTGQVKLYEINYVPANTGVVLFCKDKIGEQRVNFVPSNAYNTKNYPIVEMKDRWTYDHSSEEYHNDLQPVLVQETFGPSVFAEDGKTITKRNFGLGLFSKTTIFTDVDADDYIGFFRLINWVGDNKAFLQYGTDVIANNVQAFGQTTDQVQLEGATMNSKLALVFEGFNDFDDSETTGIKDTITEVGNNGDNSYYNLQGIKVAAPVKGIYIHNGKKVIIK